MQVQPGTYDLWWPRGYGPKPAGPRPLYLLTVQAHPKPSKGGTPEPSILERNVGFRTVELVREPLEGAVGETFFFNVNGVPIYMKCAPCACGVAAQVSMMII